MSLESSMKHHFLRSEMMEYANLIQNQAIIFQSQQLLDAQLQANSQLLENERARQKERQIDIWTDEFKYQGMSPLKAHQQALTEWEILEIYNLAMEYVEELEYLKQAAVEAVRVKKANKPLRKAMLGSLSDKFLGIDEDSDEVIMYQFSASQNHKEKILELQKRLDNLPNSQLSGDSEVQDYINYVISSPSNLELFEEISNGLDSLASVLRTVSSGWDSKIKVDYWNNEQKKDYPEMIEMYNQISAELNRIETEIGSFSVQMLRLIKSETVQDIFLSKIVTPIQQLQINMSVFESMLTKVNK